MTDFQQMRDQNVSRLKRWHGDDDDWTLADWSNAMGGEAGEAQNIVKKIRRTDNPKLWAKQLYPGDAKFVEARELAEDIGKLDAAAARERYVGKLADELADVILYADLLAHHAGIDLEAAVIAKFNRVSVAQGFPERLVPSSADLLDRGTCGELSPSAGKPCLRHRGHDGAHESATFSPNQFSSWGELDRGGRDG